MFKYQYLFFKSSNRLISSIQNTKECICWHSLERAKILWKNRGDICTAAKMEEVDAQFVRFLTSQSSTSSFFDSTSVVQFVESKTTVMSSASTTARKNFLVDSSTPHGDVVISESSVLKPSLGWVTCFVTEPLRKGVHEWCVKIDHQGETSDGSGLMLGIVPKHYTKFDSFISQGGGWCLSRAGKLYGNWRRVDNHTSVGSLTFATGDRVVFLLDMDAARMTVRVGDKSMVGDIGGLSSEVYPAVSLHYRHQHVRFEYHKVHDRSVKPKSWLERGCFPNAVLYLPVTSISNLRRLPLDSFLFSPVVESVISPSLGGDAETSDALLSPPASDPSSAASRSVSGQRVARARLVIIVRALSAVRRWRKAEGFSAALEHFMAPDITAEFLREQQSVAAAATSSSVDGAMALNSPFAANCGALLMAQIAAQVAMIGAVGGEGVDPSSVAAIYRPLLTSGAASMLEFLVQQPLFALAETGSHSLGLQPKTVSQIVAHLKSVIAAVEGEGSSSPDAAPAVCFVDELQLRQLQIVLALQTGSVAQLVWAVYGLLRRHESLQDARSTTTVQLRLSFVRWLAAVERTLQPRSISGDLLLSARRSSPPMAVAELAKCQLGPPGDPVVSMCTDGTFLYTHHCLAGLRKWGVGLRGSLPRLYASTNEPSQFLLASSLNGSMTSSLACSPTMVVCRTSLMTSASTIAVAMYSKTLSLLRLLQPQEIPKWPSSPQAQQLTLLSGGGLVGLLYYDTSQSPPLEPPNDGTSALSAAIVPPAPTAALTLTTFSSFPASIVTHAVLRTQVPSPDQHGDACLLLTKHTAIHLGEPEHVIFCPGGHVTVELWIRLFGRGEDLAATRSIYAHGDKATTGEIFLETGTQDGVSILKGGYRHDTRGSSMVAVHIPPGTHSRFLHVALVFDNRWSILLDGAATFHNVLKPTSTTPSLSLERPRVRWVVGGGCVAHVAELRVWSRSRSPPEVARDMRRSLRGDEPGLLAYFPLREERGCTLYNYAAQQLTQLQTKSRVVSSPHTVVVPTAASSSGSGSSSATLFALPQIHRETIVDHPLSCNGRSVLQNASAPLVSSIPPRRFYGDASLVALTYGTIMIATPPSDEFHGGRLLSYYDIVSGLDVHNDTVLPADVAVLEGKWACTPGQQSEASLWVLASDVVTIPLDLPPHPDMTRLRVSDIVSGSPSSADTRTAVTAAAALQRPQSQHTRSAGGPGLFGAAPAAQMVTTSLQEVSIWLLVLLHNASHVARATDADTCDRGGTVGGSTSGRVMSAFRASRDASRHLLFRPLEVDAGKDVVQACVALLRDHFRPVRSANARRVIRPREDMSPYVIDVALSVLQRQLDVVVATRLDPRPLDLAIVVGAPNATPDKQWQTNATHATTPVRTHSSPVLHETPPSPLLQRLASSLRMRTPVAGGDSAPSPLQFSPRGVASEVDAETFAHAPEHLVAYGVSGGTLGSQLVGVLCDLVNQDQTHALLPASTSSALELLRRGVLLFFPDSSTRIRLLGEMLTSAGASASARVQQQRKPAVQALLGGVLDHFSTAQAVAAIPTRVSQRGADGGKGSASNPTLQWIASALVQDAAQRCIADMCSPHSATSTVGGGRSWLPEAAEGRLSADATSALHQATLKTLAMVQLFLLAALDRTDGDRISAADRREAGQNSVVLSPQNTPPPATSNSTVVADPVDIDRDHVTQEYFGLLFSSAKSVLGVFSAQIASLVGDDSKIQKDVSSAGGELPPRHRVEGMLHVVRASLTGSILLTALSATPLVVSKGTALWLLGELKAVADATQAILRQLRSIDVACDTAQREDTEKKEQGVNPIEDLHDAVRRQLWWLSAYMSTSNLECGGTSVEASNGQRSCWTFAPTVSLYGTPHSLDATPPPFLRGTPFRVGLPTVSGAGRALGSSSKIAVFCSHPALSGGIAQMLDVSPRGVLCTELLNASHEWTQRMQPPNPIDRVGSPTVHAAWVAFVVCTLHLSSTPLPCRCASLSALSTIAREEVLATVSRVAVKCRPIKHALVEWASAASSQLVLERLHELLTMLLNVNSCASDDCSGPPAAMLHELSMTGNAYMCFSSAVKFVQSQRHTHRAPALVSVSARQRWRDAALLIKRARIAQRAAALSCESLSVDAIVLLLSHLCLPSAKAGEVGSGVASDVIPSAIEVQQALHDASAIAHIRLLGIEHLVTETGHRGDVIDALEVFAEAMSTSQAAHLDDALLGADETILCVSHRHFTAVARGCHASAMHTLHASMHSVLHNALTELLVTLPSTGDALRSSASELRTQQLVACSLSRVLLHHPWSEEDFIWFTSDHVAERLTTLGSIFASESGSALKPEGSVEGGQRAVVKDRSRQLRGDNSGSAATAAFSGSPSEEQLHAKTVSLLLPQRSVALAWEALKALSLRCVELLQRKQGLVKRRACEHFLSRTFRAITSELRRCYLYASHYYFPSQERVSEQVGLLCTLLATIAKAIEGSQKPQRVRVPWLRAEGSIGTAAATLLMLAQPPSLSSTTSSDCVLTSGILMEMLQESAMERIFCHGVTEMSSLSPNTADQASLSRAAAATDSPVVSALISVALRSVHTAGPVAPHNGGPNAVISTLPGSEAVVAHLSPLCAATVATLRRLIMSPRWPRVLPTLSARAVKELNSVFEAQAGTMASESKRDAALAVMLITFSVCGYDADVPRQGSEVRYCVDSELRIAENGFLVDINVNTQCGVVLPANAEDVSSLEIEVPLDALRCSWLDIPSSLALEDGAGQLAKDISPFAAGRLPNPSLLATFIEPMLRAVAPRWHSASSLVHLPLGSLTCACVASWLRTLSTIVQHDVVQCATWSEDGFLHDMYETFACHPVTSPMPLRALQECACIPLAIHLKQLQQPSVAHTYMMTPRSAHTTSLSFGVDSHPSGLSGTESAAAMSSVGAMHATYRYAAQAMVAAAVNSFDSAQSSTAFLRALSHHSSVPDGFPASAEEPTVQSSGLSLRAQWLPSVLMLTNESAGARIKFASESGDGAFPSLRKGVTIDVSFFFHDGLVQRLGEPFAVPARWGKPLLRRVLLSLRDGTNDRDLVRFEVARDRLLMLLPSEPWCSAADSPTSPRNSDDAGQCTEDGQQPVDFDQTDACDISAAPVVFTVPSGASGSAARGDTGSPPTVSGTLVPYTLMPFMHNEATERWMRVTILLHEGEVLVYRDGELGAIQSFDRRLLQRARVDEIVIGRGGVAEEPDLSPREDSPPSIPTSQVSVRNFRLWSLPLPKHLIRVGGDPAGLSAALETALTAAGGSSSSSSPHLPEVQIRFHDGSGDTASGDDGAVHAELLGGARWAPLLPLPLTTSVNMTLESDADAALNPPVEAPVPPLLPSSQQFEQHWASSPSREDAEDHLVDFLVPRREIALHFGAQDPSAVSHAVLTMYSSLAGHYARRLILHALETLTSARAVAVFGSGDTRCDPRGVVRHPTQMLSVLSNLTRYWSGSQVPTRYLTTAARVAQIAMSSTLQEAAAEPSKLRDACQWFLSDSFQQFQHETESFDVDIAYPVHTPSAGEALACPMAIMNGGTACLAFDAPRSMEYLHVFADKGQKTTIAKLPDAQGFFQDQEISCQSLSGGAPSCGGWCFFKPSATLKATPAHFRVRCKSHRASMGHLGFQILCRMLEPDQMLGEPFASQLMAVLLDQRVVTLLASWVRSTRGERRIGHMHSLSMVLTLWASHPTVHPYDQCPLHLLLDRINQFLVHTQRRTALHPITAFTASGVAAHPPVLRKSLELITAAIIAEAAWERESDSTARFADGWRRLQVLRQEAVAADIDEVSSPIPSAAIEDRVGLSRVSSITATAGGGTPVWRPRGPGVWCATSDRGCQTLRSTTGVRRGRWYMEVRVSSSGSPISVGVVTKAFKAMMEGSSSSLGQCGNSWGFDGARLCRWHNAIRNEFTTSNRAKWKARDVIGLLLDLEAGTLVCTHNGKPVSAAYDNLPSAARPSSLRASSSGNAHAVYYMAVSFATSGCDVNFGAAPFVFDLPPGGFLPIDLCNYRLLSSVGHVVASLNAVAMARLILDSVGARDQCFDVPSSLPRHDAQTEDAENCRRISTTTASRHGLSDVLFVQADGKRRSFGHEVRTTDVGCMLRGTCSVDSGRWYFEVLVQGDGQFQVGWAALPFTQRTIGDDSLSWGIDGCRMVARHNKHQRSLGRHPWRDGDVVGCFINVDEGHIGFTVNGLPLRDLHDTTSNGTLFQWKPQQLAASVGGGLLQFCPVLQLEPTTFVSVFVNRGSISYLPPAYEPVGAYGTVLESMTRHALSTSSRLTEHSGSCAQGAALETESPLNARCRLHLPTLSVLLESISKVHDMTAFHTNYWNSSDFFRQHWQAVRGVLQSSPQTEQAAVDERRLCDYLSWINAVEEVLSTLQEFTAAWEETTPPPMRRGGCSRLTLAEAVCVLRQCNSPGIGLAALQSFVCTTNRPAGEHAKLKLNRRLASAAMGTARLGADPTSSVVPATIPPLAARLAYSIFGQVFSLVGRKPASLFMTGKKLWSVTFVGEGADDVGGPYRESLSELCGEMMSPQVLDLFELTANHASNSGSVRDRVTVASTPLAPVNAATYVFIGRLMGGCLRSGEPLPLYLPRSFWRRLLGEPFTAEELDESDSNAWRSLSLLASDDDEALEDDIRFTRMNASTSGGGDPLFHGSSEFRVDRKNVHAFIALSAYAECAPCAREGWDCIIAGFFQVVPPFVLRGLRCGELEQLVCGLADFDVDQFIQSARLDGLQPKDRRICYLQNVLKSFTRHERAMFLRFVTGRERLPSGLRLKLMPSSSSSASAVTSDEPETPSEYDDDHLPHASTCFFWLSLPNYSSEAVMRSKLLFAIEQCVDIDADFRVRGDAEDELQGPAVVVQQSSENDDDEFEDYRHLL